MDDEKNEWQKLIDEADPNKLSEKDIEGAKLIVERHLPAFKKLAAE